MTAQALETIIYNGEEYGMASEPLSDYLEKTKILFISPHTALWRGYYGKWKIENNRLFLVELKAYITGHQEVGLDFLFPGEQKVFADWFTGTIRIHQGEILQYVHMGYESVYEKDLIIEFEKGIVKNKYVIDNTKKQAGEAPDTIS